MSRVAEDRYRDIGHMGWRWTWPCAVTHGLGKLHSRMHTYHHAHNASRLAIVSCTQHWRLALRRDFILRKNFNLRAEAISTIDPGNKYLAALDLR